MQADTPPRKANLAGFRESEGIKTLDLPQGGCWISITQSIESAMKAERSADVRRACADFLHAASEFYDVANCGIRVLAARPLVAEFNPVPRRLSDGGIDSWYSNPKRAANAGIAAARR